MFDVTLMITLLINLADFNCYDTLPLVSDITLSADLGRIKLYRNLISHSNNGTIDNASFNTAWEDIVEVCITLIISPLWNIFIWCV